MFTFLRSSSETPSQFNFLEMELTLIREQAKKQAGGVAELEKFLFTRKAARFLVGKRDFPLIEGGEKNLALWNLSNPQVREEIVTQAQAFFYPHGTDSSSGPLYGIDPRKNFFESPSKSENVEWSKLFSFLQEQRNLLAEKSAMDSSIDEKIDEKKVFEGIGRDYLSNPVYSSEYGFGTKNEAVMRFILDEAVAYFFKTP